MMQCNITVPEVLAEWIEADESRAVHAMNIGRAVIDSGVLDSTDLYADDLPEFSDFDDRRSLAESLSGNRLDMPELISQAWPACEIIANGEGYIVILDSGECVTIHVVSVTLVSGDVVRKAADIADICQRYPNLRASIFVSTRSRNIPTKGSLKVDVKNDILMGWVGYDQMSGSDFVQFLSMFRILLVAPKSNDNSETSVAAASIKSVLHEIEAQQLIIDRMRVALTELNDSIIRSRDRLMSRVAVKEPVIEKISATVYTCKRCKKQYQLHAYYAKHIAACK